MFRGRRMVVMGRGHVTKRMGCCNVIVVHSNVLVLLLLTRVILVLTMYRGDDETRIWILIGMLHTGDGSDPVTIRCGNIACMDWNVWSGHDGILMGSAPVPKCQR